VERRFEGAQRQGCANPAAATPPGASGGGLAPREDKGEGVRGEDSAQTDLEAPMLSGTPDEIAAIPESDSGFAADSSAR
jgi:hypothetical protein